MVFIGKVTEMQWKCQMDSNSSKVWLRTVDYLLTEKEKNILLSDSEWFNDNIMDAAQKLISKALRSSLESYQSVLNWQKKGTPFFEFAEEHIQLMHDGVNHWLLSFNLNGRVQICDSLHTNLTQVTKNCLKGSTSHNWIRVADYQSP